jgi:hypothetical protein
MRTFATAFFCVLFPFVCHASLEITEVMYNPPGTDTKNEWIEIHNLGEHSLNIEGYFLQANGLTSTYHAFSPETTSSIPSGGYAVIVQDIQAFRTAFPGFSGILIDSTWSDLTNTTGKLLVINTPAKVPVAQYLYDPSIGGANTGTSLQKTSAGIWIEALPTPGSATTATVSTPIQTDDDKKTSTQDTSGEGTVIGSDGMGDLASISSSIPLEKQGVTSPKPGKLSISTLRSSVVGVPIPVILSVIGHFGEDVHGGEYRISFGDGHGSAFSNISTISHTYEYPGTYNITVYYRKNKYAPYPDAYVRTKIAVYEPSLLATVHPDNSFSLQNTDSREIDISHWTIYNSIGDISYTVPEGTYILAKETIRIPTRILGFTASSEPLIHVRTPSGSLAVEYSQPVMIRSAIEEIPPETKVLIEQESYEREPNTQLVVPFMVACLFLVLSSAYAIYHVAREEAKEAMLREMKEV